MCKDAGCNKQAIQNRFCLAHSSQGMLNTSERVQQKNKKSTSKCKYDGCLAEAKFNYDGERYRLYCSQHKLSDMVSVARKKRGQQIQSEPTTGPSLPVKGHGRECRGPDTAPGPCSLEQDVQGGQLFGAKGRPLNLSTLPKYDDGLSTDAVRPRHVPYQDDEAQGQGGRGADVQ